MLTKSKNPLSSEQDKALDVWLHTKEADTMTACVRAQKAGLQVDSMKVMDTLDLEVLAVKEMPQDAVNKAREAARLGIFLEVWRDISNGKLDLSLIRIDVT